MRNKLKELFKRYRVQIDYVIAGSLTTLVSLLAYYIPVLTFLDPENPVQLQIANIISWVCAVTFAYFVNRSFVFRSKNPGMLAEAARFFGARVSTLLIDMAFMALFVTVLRLSDKPAKLIVQVIVFVLNYIFSRFLVFRKKTAKKELREESEQEVCGRTESGRIHE